MNRRFPLLLAVVGLMAGSCSPAAAPSGPPQTPEPRPAPAAEPPADAGSPASVATAETFDAATAPVLASSVPDPTSPVASWTDPDAVALLAVDCGSEPPPRPEGEPNPLSCAVLFDQSCVYDPCFQHQQDCRGQCSKTCRSCDSTCVQICRSCRAGCRDDACKKACARQTGACKEGCVTKLDHCSTSACAMTAKVCVKDEYRKWNTHACSCQTMNECINPCLAGDGSNTGACLKRCQARTPGCDIGYCIMGAGHPDAPDPPTKE